jgi:hypothetical protein
MSSYFPACTVAALQWLFYPPSDIIRAKSRALSEMSKFIAFLVSHGIAMAAGFALGIYLLPILIAPGAPSDGQEFLAIKENSAYIGDIKTFDNFILNVPENVNPANFSAVVVWCETFGEFIAAASYQ